jgi:hypothetical protein
MNSVVSVKKKIKDEHFNYIGKSKLDGTFLYEVDIHVLDIRNEKPVRFKYRLLNTTETDMNIVPWDYKNTIDVFDPFGYKEHYK